MCNDKVFYRKYNMVTIFTRSTFSLYNEETIDDVFNDYNDNDDDEMI